MGRLIRQRRGKAAGPAGRKRPGRRPSLLLVLGFAASGTVEAQMVTDRPDQSESAFTVGAGNFQLESGLLMGFEGEKGYSVRNLQLPSNLMRYGLTRAVELRAVSQFESVRYDRKTIEGISDLEFGLKVALVDGNKHPLAVALLSHAVLPTGSVELTGDAYGVSNKICLSHALNDRLSLGGNAGYDYAGEGKGDLTWSLVLGVEINEKTGIYVESYGAFVGFEESVSSFDSGFAFLANDNLQFDLSYGTGLNHRMNYIAVGCSWLFEGRE